MPRYALENVVITNFGRSGQTESATGGDDQHKDWIPILSGPSGDSTQNSAPTIDYTEIKWDYSQSSPGTGDTSAPEDDFDFANSVDPAEGDRGFQTIEIKRPPKPPGDYTPLDTVPEEDAFDFAIDPEQAEAEPPTVSLSLNYEPITPNYDESDRGSDGAGAIVDGASSDDAVPVIEDWIL